MWVPSCVVCAACCTTASPASPAPRASPASPACAASCAANQDASAGESTNNISSILLVLFVSISQRMPNTVLMVAEKPSIAQSIASILSRGKVYSHNIY